MALQPVGFEGKSILITGATGMVSRPLVREYSKAGKVYAMARYARAEDRRAIEELGGIPIAADLAKSETFSAIPEDVDYVINCAVGRSNKFEHDFPANAEGVGFLMARCRRAKAFLHVSTTGVYEYRGHEPRKESDPLADNHRVMSPTYSISKIAGERVCIFAARQFGIPTTIARLCVPYGECGGWPYFHLMMMKNGAPIEVHPDRPNYYNLLHVEDYIGKNSAPAGRRHTRGDADQLRRVAAREYRGMVRLPRRVDRAGATLRGQPSAFRELVHRPYTDGVAGGRDQGGMARRYAADGTRAGAGIVGRGQSRARLSAGRSADRGVCAAPHE